MRQNRIIFESPLSLSLQGSTSRPVSLPTIPEITFLPSSAGASVKISAALTVNEVYQIVDIFPISERNGKWRVFWQRQYQSWLQLSPQDLSLWLIQALLHRDMYPLLYAVPPVTPSLECMTLLERMPPDATTTRNAAVTLALESTIKSNNWKLFNSLLPIVGRLQIEPCLDQLIILADRDATLREQVVTGESLYRNVYRCFASFKDPRLISCFKKGLTIKQISDICFTALLQSETIFEFSFLDDIVGQFNDDAEYLIELFRRFLAEAMLDPRAAMQALHVLREISQDSSSYLAERLDNLIDNGLERSSFSNRPPTRNEIKATSFMRMQDLEPHLEPG